MEALANPLMQALDAHLDAHRTNGKVWPVDAEFAVSYRSSTWPCGWADFVSTEFFNNRKELDAWITVMHRWASEEDNDFAYQAYSWDWGPQAMEDLHHNLQNL